MLIEFQERKGYFDFVWSDIPKFFQNLKVRYLIDFVENIAELKIRKHLKACRKMLTYILSYTHD